MFACAGKFNVSYKGVLRDPSEALITKLTSKCSSNVDSGTFKDNIIKGKLIKIPDIYTVEMTFQSLLPANFNNFLYMYSENKSQMEQYKGAAYTKSVAVDMMSSGIKNFTEKLKGHWDGDNFPES